MEVVMTKERISAALVIGTCRVDKGSAAHDVSHCEVNFQMQAMMRRIYIDEGRTSIIKVTEDATSESFEKSDNANMAFVRTEMGMSLHRRKLPNARYKEFGSVQVIAGGYYLRKARDAMAMRLVTADTKEENKFGRADK
ncbi:hypothetical protein Tco_0598594 [Tanacetum coccineum]